MRSEFASLQAAFDKMPGIGNNAQQFVRVNAGGTALESVNNAVARTGLGLGTISTQDANNVSITGGTISGVSKVNNVVITPPSASATLTIQNNVTLTVNNSVTIAANNGAVVTLQGTDTYVGRATTDTLTNKTLTNPANTTQALTDAAPTTWDTSLGAIATWTMGASRTISAPTNLKTGGRYVLVITQDGTGGRVVTWNGVFKGPGGQAMTAIQPCPTASSITSFAFDYDGTNLYVAWWRIGNIQTFAGNGTYTPAAGMRWCKVTVVGGGGGSGGCNTTGAGQSAAATGGGGGGYAIKLVSAATVGASQTVTVGAGGLAGTAGANQGGTGGTTSFGAIVSATGGVGGNGSGASSNVQTGQGGTQASGGSGSSGDVNGTGQGGFPGLLSPNGQVGGNGGSSLMGGGALGVSSVTNSGNSGSNYGGGAAGSSQGANQGASVTGAAGGGGICIVEEFF